MSGKTIATIYFYVISAASLALIVTGIFHTVNFVINSTQYERYPVRYRSEDCETYPFYQDKYVPRPLTPEASTPSAEEVERERQQCLRDLERERKQTRLDDIKNAITFTIVGIVLFLIHFPLARKQSTN